MAAPVVEGQILAGKYQVQHILGEGGMGVVVAAKHLQLDQKVALKFLLPEALADKDTVTRFAREARAACKISSEHVARVLDVGTMEDTGAPYMVMEYLNGRDLADVLTQRGKLPVSEACDYLLQASEAVAEAHANGIVHRDLKPTNLFVANRADGTPMIKVLDFGISKAVSSDPNMAVTKTTAIMGSPLYMSPEQLRASRDVDMRADIWALGIILYELVTGATPFYAPTVPQLCSIIMFEPGTPISENLDPVPEGLEAIINRCLEKDVAKRYQHVGELAGDLAKLAPASARIHVERIQRVLGAVGFATPVVVPEPIVPGPPSIRKVMESASTATDWARSSSQVQVSRAPMASASGAPPSMVAPASAPSRTPMIIGGAVGAVALAAVAIFAMSRSGAPKPDATSAAPAGSASKPGIDTIHVKIAATPPQAKLFLDDAQLPSNPYATDLRRDGEGHKLRAEAPGFTTKSAFLVFDKDLENTIALDADATPSTGGTTPDVKAPPRSNGNVGVGGPMPKPAPGKKGGAKIDDSDPYAK